VLPEADVRRLSDLHRRLAEIGPVADWQVSGGHARTLWRHLCKIYDGPTMALHRTEPLPAWLVRRLPANDR
jgi:hypothetical protein